MGFNFFLTDRVNWHASSVNGCVQNLEMSSLCCICSIVVSSCCPSFSQARKWTSVQVCLVDLIFSNCYSFSFVSIRILCRVGSSCRDVQISMAYSNRSVQSLTVVSKVAIPSLIVAPRLLAEWPTTNSTETLRSASNIKIKPNQFHPLIL